MRPTWTASLCAIVLLLAGALARAGAAEADGPAPDRLEAWLQGPNATGDWFGYRQKLIDLGIEPAFGYAADILGNPVGGKVGKVRYFQDIFLGLTFDLDTLVGVPGAQVEASMSSRAGNDLSKDIGNVFNVSQTCCSPQTRLVTLAWRQTLFDDRLDIRIGHISMGDDFAASPLYLLFVTSGIDANPASLSFNFPFSEYPDASFGLRIRGDLLENLSLQVGAYENVPQFTGTHGTDFGLSPGDGVVLLSEVQYRHSVGPGATTLPGHVTLGGYYDTGQFMRLDAPPQSNLPSDHSWGNGGMYLTIDQQVARFGAAGDGRGVTPFLALTGAPAAEINPFPFFFDAGLVVEGPWAARPDDALLFGMVFGAFSGDLREAQRAAGEPPQDFEMVFEWSYVVQVTPWLQIQPDMQLVVRPGGTGEIPDALVLGAQIALTL